MRVKWRGLELPNRLSCQRETLTDTYGKFFAEPFERGFGVTVGNSLRRILLSSLEGSAVTRVKIQGVAHEITTIPGVVEDVTDIVLNLKEVRVKLHDGATEETCDAIRGPGTHRRAVEGHAVDRLVLGRPGGARRRLLRIAAICVMIAGLISLARGVMFLQFSESALPHSCPFCGPAGE